MKFGFSEAEYRLLEEKLFAPLRAKQAKIFIFGSRARGSHHKFSDVDILVQSDSDLSSLINQLIEDILHSSVGFDSMQLSKMFIRQRITSFSYRLGNIKTVRLALRTT